jgi:prephenate dehydratase
MRVGYQGAPGAFGEAAALGLWPEAEPIGVTTFEDVVSGVRSGRLDAGVLPVENVIVGPVRQALVALAQATDLEQSRELTLPVTLQLLGTKEATLESLATVLGHPVALAQCSRFLGRIRATIRNWYDSAAAARMLGERNDRTLGVIASRAAAVRYGLAILTADVHDRPDNATRFIGLERRR